MAPDSGKFSKSRVLRQQAHDLIPGGCHTYAKGDDQYPEISPAFIVRGSVCHVWDVDGNDFIEYGMGLRAVTLGHAYKPVVEAAYRQMLLGTNFTRPSPVELECAEALLDLIPAAEQVKFAKDGSTVLTAAVTLARAYTGRDMVAICAEHPFFSYNDWFIGTTGMSAGVPAAIRSLTVKFHYNDLASAETLFRRYPDKIACVVLEAARTDEPVDDFLHKLQNLCKREGAVFVLDEMITGFRWTLGGAQQAYDIAPDLSAFGKAMANGYALSALTGKREIMELGGLKHNRERVFLLSTTHGAENHALAAALKSMEIYRTDSVVEHLYHKGQRIIDGIQKIIDALGLAEYFQLLGRPCNLVYVTRDQEQRPSQAFRTLFLQETIKRGIIAPSFVVSFSHSNDDIDHTIEATGDALLVYKKALSDGIEGYLVGPSVKPVYRRFN
jgi:glutamate-1-semialdehyde 2,1-aminomutase